MSQGPLGALHRGGAPDPQAVGPWAIEGAIARGGMGAVYRAVDRRTGRRAALKLILAGRGATPEQRRRFAREVEAMRALDAEGAVRVLDADPQAEVPWYAMELIDGPSLGAAMADLDLRRRVELLAQVARVVGQAHAKGYVHRDLKPDNVLLERRDGALVARVTDFGLAKQVGGESRLTADGAVLGTPHYMAPEQATGEVARTGPPTDVFALGVMLYELATGRLPFAGQTALELLAQIVELEPAPFESGAAGEAVDADGPRRLLLALEPVARRALEKRPEDRYPTAAALADDLERVLRGEAPAGARGPSRLLRGARARPLRAAALVLLPLVALTGVVVVGVVLRAEAARRAEAAARGAAWAQAVKELERAAGPAASDAQALAAALDRADASGELDPALSRRARLRLLEVAAQDEGAEAAAEALGRVRLGDPPLRDLDEGERAAALLARGRLKVRLGDTSPAELDELRALGPAAAPAADLLEGVAALVEGDLERALGALARASQAAQGAGEAGALRALVLGRLGRIDEAREAAERAGGDPGGGPDGRRRLAEGLLLRAADAPDPAALDAAWDALAGALRAAPGDARVARRLLALARATGRAWEAAEALDAAARRPTAAPELGALAAAARSLVDPATEPPATPATALLRADLAAGAATRPYAALAAGEPAGPLVLAARAARARDGSRAATLAPPAPPSPPSRGACSRRPTCRPTRSRRAACAMRPGPASTWVSGGGPDSSSTARSAGCRSTSTRWRSSPGSSRPPSRASTPPCASRWRSSTGRSGGGSSWRARGWRSSARRSRPRAPCSSGRAWPATRRSSRPRCSPRGRPARPTRPTRSRGSTRWPSCPSQRRPRRRSAPTRRGSPPPAGRTTRTPTASATAAPARSTRGPPGRAGSSRTCATAPRRGRSTRCSSSPAMRGSGRTRRSASSSASTTPGRWSGPARRASTTSAPGRSRPTTPSIVSLTSPTATSRSSTRGAPAPRTRAALRSRCGARSTASWRATRG
ncbi:MAG: serine/threonine protein kinase [Planctomycetes bacterium]|nr:serine/threonine protein kinase [Planctomycetota bacterium]